MLGGIVPTGPIGPIGAPPAAALPAVVVPPPVQAADITRVLDSRTGVGLFAPWRLLEVRDLDVTDTYESGVPDSGADAIVLNVTVTDTQSPGFLTVFPTVAAVPPNASNLNWARGSTIPNLTITRLPASGFLSIYNGSMGLTNVIADSVGWLG